MPELPEVETVCRGLRRHIVGREITEVRVFYPRVIHQEDLDVKSFAQQLKGNLVKSVERRGKYIVFVLTDGWLMCHLRMTGKLLVRPKDTEIGKHDLAVFSLDSGKWLFYEDVRRFGGFYYTKENPYQHSPLNILGPEPLTDDFDGMTLWENIKNRKRPIKACLLDQTIIAGIGNIYADEILFKAGIRPRKSASRLTKKECNAIADATKEVLKEAVLAGGSTIRDYVDSENRQGTFQLAHQVYGRAGKCCYCCGTTLKNVIVGGRSSVYCPKCQKS